MRLGTSVGEFDPAYPVVLVLFDGYDQITIPAGESRASGITEYSIPAGTTTLVAYYVSAGGYVATTTSTGWSSYSALGNEPTKSKKTGYTSTTTILGLEKIEVFDKAFGNMMLVSKQLPLSSAPANVDIAVFFDCDSGYVGDFSLSLSRDGTTWKAVTLGTFYTLNGKTARVVYGVDLSSGGDMGSALYWKVASSNNRAVKLNTIMLMQDAGVFTDVPSTDMRESAPVVTRRHMESTGLGYKPSSTVLYGRLWGAQDWEVKGPMRFRYKFHAQIIHSGSPSGTAPVAWTLAMSKTYAVDAVAMGAKLYEETDTPPFTGNDFMKWVDFTSGNIADADEHYKEGFLSTAYWI